MEKNLKKNNTYSFFNIYSYIYSYICMVIYIYIYSFIYGASLVAQTAKNLPAMWETWV